jgi:hypothetical protein
MAVHMEFVIDKMARGQFHLQASCFCHAGSFEPAASSNSLSVRTSKHLLYYLMFVNKIHYLQENGMIMNGKLERMLKEVVMSNLKIPSQHLTGGTENYHQNPVSE